MERGGKPQSVLDAVAAGSPAERAFGGYMNHLGLERIHFFSQASLGPDRKVNTGVARARPGPEKSRVNHRNAMASAFELTHQFHQRGHHAVDLGLPGVSDQSDLHTEIATVWPFPWALVAGCQCTSSSVPSKFSTSAVRLSTQSPSLQYSTPSMSRISAR